MIFPTDHRWKELERGTKFSFLIVVLIYLVVATIGYFKPGPGEKDRQVYAWVSSNYELGLIAAKGYNLSALGVTSTVYLGECQVYIMAPPIYHILLTGVYALSGQDWRSLRLGPVFFDLIYLYGCLALAVKFFKGRQRSWLLFFALTPMILIFSAWNDLRGTTMGILIIAYLCFTNYLESGKIRWVVWSGVIYLFAFWIDYAAFSIVPAILLQILFHPGLTLRKRTEGFAIFSGFVIISTIISFVHFAALPGGVDWFTAHLAERFSNHRPGTGGGSTYSIQDFAARQMIRFATHYTPISVFLAGWAFVLALGKLVRRQIVPVPQNGYVTVDPYITLLVLFTWGIPNQSGIQVAYIHPLFMYYFTGFFAFAPVLGLASISERFKSTSLRQFIVSATLVGFLLLSVGRSVFNLTGGSLFDLVMGVNSPSAELYTVEQLKDFTCHSWQLK